jgi:acyl transferase domain-containing protein
VYSANSADSLKQVISNYSDFIEKNPETIGDLAYTLSNRRVHLTHRAFAIANRYGTGTVSPIVKIGQQPSIVMIFTGQGAKWPGMGRELLKNPDCSVFKDSIRSLDRYLQATPFAPDWSIEEELLKPAKTSRLNTAELSQPLCTALQSKFGGYSLVDGR